MVLSTDGRKMDYEGTLAVGADPFALFLCALIGGVMMPDRRGRGFPVGWGDDRGDGGLVTTNVVCFGGHQGDVYGRWESGKLAQRSFSGR